MKGSSRRHETFYCDRTNTAIRTTVDCSQPTTLAYNSTPIRYTNLPFAKRVSTDASFQMFILHRLLVTGRRPSRFSLEPFPPPPLEDDEKVVEESKPQKDQTRHSFPSPRAIRRILETRFRPTTTYPFERQVPACYDLVTWWELTIPAPKRTKKDVQHIICLCMCASPPRGGMLY